ncbi:MAG: M48 family peptidase, partial [Deltaproteobacteria bacterium]|nr:M48 family peptidase [Deltaproteobacteria bacterium]
MNTYLIVILLILIIRYLLDLVSDWLNVRHVSTELPAEFKGYYDAEKYRQSQNYLRENTRFGICVDTLQTLITIIFVLVGGFNFVDRIAISLGQGPILTGLVFAGILIFASKILNLPFSIYNTFVIEEKYGFNKTT